MKQAKYMKVLKNCTVVTAKKVLENHEIVIENGRIIEISPEFVDSNCETIDCNGAYVMPGIIDIHSDMIENLLQPRSTAMMDFQTGLDEAEKQLCACGITTIYHSVSMYRQGSWDSKEIRTSKSVERLAELIKLKKNENHLINNKYHLRYELDNIECYDNVISLIENRLVDLLSIMDHRPGQGQYRNLDIYRKHLPGEGKNLSDQEFSNLVKKEKKKPMIRGEKLSKLIKIAKKNDLSISSHDDDTVECIERNMALGVDISEFPITLEVAQEAKRCGIATLLGAPNILLGGSHSGNLSAQKAIEAKCGDILCSDYYPQALLRSIFYLVNKNILTLPEATNLVTLNPAKAVKISKQTGSIKVGKRADLIVVSLNDEGCPTLEKVFVRGKKAMSLEYSEVK